MGYFNLARPTKVRKFLLKGIRVEIRDCRWTNERSAYVRVYAHDEQGFLHNRDAAFQHAQHCTEVLRSRAMMMASWLDNLSLIKKIDEID